MKRLKKHIFLKLIYGAVGVLFVVRLVTSFTGKDSTEDVEVKADSVTTEVPWEGEKIFDSLMTADSAARQAALEHKAIQDSLRVLEVLNLKVSPSPTPPRRLDMSYKHPIRSVSSYAEAFPDLQDTHYAAASLHGVRPVQNREEAERRKSELVYIAANPFFRIDSAMHQSIPYLVPRASLLLHDIARAFVDSQAVKRIPPHTIIVTSVLRTEDDVTRLRRVNSNASEQSCHRFGTTFDVSYYQFHTVGSHTSKGIPDDIIGRRKVQNDTLKYILSEVLRDLRADGRCYVKHEVKQGCFHITTR